MVEGSISKILDYIVLYNGLPIYSKNVDPVLGITNDESRFTLLSGFLSAISSFVDSMNNLGQIEEIQMSSEINFFFQRSCINDTEMLFIVVSSQVTSKQLAKSLLQTMTTRFLDTFLNDLIQWHGNLTLFKKFDHDFDRIMSETIQMIDNENDHEKFNSRKLNPFFALSSKSNSPTNKPVQCQNRTNLGQLRVNSRFNRYRILRGYQSQARVQESDMSRMIVGETNLPWFNMNEWTTQGDTDNKIALDENDFPEEGVQSSQNTSYDNQIEMSSLEMRHYISDALRNSNPKPKKTNPFSISCFELIPSKESVPQGIIVHVLNNPWKKSVYKAINDQISIREIAGVYGVSPDDVYEICAEFNKLGLITFRE